MASEEMGQGVADLLDVQGIMNMPGIESMVWDLRGTQAHVIAVFFTDAVERGVERGIHQMRRRDHNVFRQKAIKTQDKRREKQRLGGEEIDDLPRCVDAGIRAASRLERGGMLHDLFDCCLQSLFNATTHSRFLPSQILPSIVGNHKFHIMHEWSLLKVR